MNKKIMMSGLSIISALTLLGGTAFAAFTTQATATGNTFSTDNPALLISSDSANYFGDIVNPFNDANIVPGYERTFTFYLKNTGNSALDVNAHFTGVADILDNVLVTDFDCSNAADPSAFSVTSMKGGSVSLGTIQPGAPNALTCHVKVTLPVSVDDTYKNRTSVFTVEFNGTTVAPSPIPAP